MVLSGNKAATLFVLTVSPIVSPADELRAGQLKTSIELEQELQYWLRFTASNSRPSAAPPTAVVVITHKDTLSTSTAPVHVKSWLRSAQDIIAHLAAKVQWQGQSTVITRHGECSEGCNVATCSEPFLQMASSTPSGGVAQPCLQQDMESGQVHWYLLAVEEPVQHLGDWLGDSHRAQWLFRLLVALVQGLFRLLVASSSILKCSSFVFRRQTSAFTANCEYGEGMPGASVNRGRLEPLFCGFSLPRSTLAPGHASVDRGRLHWNIISESSTQNAT